MTPTQEALAKANRALARVQARLVAALRLKKPEEIKKEILEALNMMGGKQ